MLSKITWVAAWFVRIPGLEHITKYTVMRILQDKDYMKVMMLVLQVKKLCI